MEELLLQLVDVTSPVGGWRANAAGRSFYAFLRAANHINPLFVRIPERREFTKEDLARKGKILGALIAALEALRTICPMEPDAPDIKPGLRAHAEALNEWYGGVKL